MTALPLLSKIPPLVLHRERALLRPHHTLVVDMVDMVAPQFPAQRGLVAPVVVVAMELPRRPGAAPAQRETPPQQRAMPPCGI